MKNIFLFLCLCSTMAIRAQQPTYMPAPGDREEIIHYTSYSMSYNFGYVIPSWIAYDLTKTNITGTNDVKPKYIPDPNIRTRAAEKKDYKNSSYIMGQMVMARDMKHSGEAMKETYYMSNIAPMKMAFYKYMWVNLTNLTHIWLNDTDTLFIVSGPVLTDAPFGTLGENKVSQVKRYYKVILDKKNEKAIAFIFKNIMSSQSLKMFAVSVDEAEEIAGMDFFSQLPDETESKIESTYNISDWDFSSLEQ